MYLALSVGSCMITGRKEVGREASTYPLFILSMRLVGYSRCMIITLRFASLALSMIGRMIWLGEDVISVVSERPASNCKTAMS